MKTIFKTSLFALLLTSLSLGSAAAQHKASEAECYIGQRYTYTADHLYVGETHPDYYDVVPVWQAEAAEVTAVATTPAGYRFYVRTASGTEGYFDVANLSEVRQFLQPAAASTASTL